MSIRNRQTARLLFLAPALVYLAALYGFPIVSNVATSLEHYTVASFFTGQAPFVGLVNFAHLFQEPDFGRAASNTVLFTVGSLLFQFTLGLGLALLFQRHFPLSTALRGLLLIPWLAPTVVSGAVWVRLFNLDAGVVNFLLRSTGVASGNIGWLTSPSLSILSVLIANIWIGIPFNMVILYAGLQAIPETLYEAAMVDGATGWQRFRHITLPLLRPVAAVVLLLGLVYTLRQFDLVMAVTNGGPANSSQTLNTFAYSLSFAGPLDFGLGAAAADILMAVVLVFGLIYLRFFHLRNE